MDELKRLEAMTEALIEKSPSAKEALDSILKRRQAHGAKPVIREVRRYQQAVAGMKSIMNMYASKVLDDNVESLLQGDNFDYEEQIPRAIAGMLHIIQIDMADLLETYADLEVSNE
jgi:hypothetical protein